jgi:hypothetical protein
MTLSRIIDNNIDYFFGAYECPRRRADAPAKSRPFLLEVLDF